jgi:MFS family permease
VTNYLDEGIVAPLQEQAADILTTEFLTSESPAGRISKDEIRASLHASTLDGVFATLFSNITGGVLLSNFLVELNATSLQIGMLASIPMVANLLQPLGAHWADRTTSRRGYSLWIYGISRLLWLPLAIAVIAFSQHPVLPQQMIIATLAVLFTTHVLSALGSASWLCWLATLVPRQLRGRYFGWRNSTFSLTSLIALPLLGLVVSHWSGGSIQGFGVMVVLAVIAGLISLGFQSQMADVNPTEPKFFTKEVTQTPAPVDDQRLPPTKQFILLILYFGLWSFGVNFSNPFFNLYLLDNLALDVSWVTLYSGLGAGANLIMLLFWGKLADRIGNRPILLLDGLLVAVIPLLWLGTDAGALSIWLWFPLLHLLGGGAGAAIDLCLNNLQLSVAPMRYYTKYFALTAAIGGGVGAVGALVGGWLAELTEVGGITGVFALSSALRLVALLPLVWIQEPQRRSLRQTLQRFLQPAELPPPQQTIQ